MSTRFEGKVALVVGGANADEDRLLGFAGLSALKIARDGGKVVIGDIDDEAGTRSVNKMKSAGLTADYVHMDVTSESDWQEAVDKTCSLHGRLDIMIMAAGIPDRGETIDSTDVDSWRRVMDVTNLGMFLGTRAVVEPMRNSGGGSIVLISSMMARVVRDQANAYATSRAGMTHFARSAAVQYGADNIRVNTVLPGWTLTPFTANAFDDEWSERLAKRVPLGRVADASDIAGPILFLASDEAKYVTGSELLADGGVTGWIGPMD
ncbi:MAG: SDR family oxidoreductase [Chloroflexi bacterium]|jgi:NAD(P)-dependent dehydrogenase (short-subunit alcohol dehydrogenase family)|nr:SDR family oxidoreductase [Chloroflexota bacterium]MDA1282417.1 SDR family oxidoreductase [Chloroflexota bacterium]